MDFTTFLWTTFAAFVTLAIFSFLYKDNPFYKFAEHLVVGVSAGYFLIILWHNTMVPNLFQRLEDGSWYLLWIDSTKPWYIIPAILGIMMWTRFSKKYSWVSRWPMAMYIGISTGVAIPLEMKARVNSQLHATMTAINWGDFLGHGGINLLDTTSGLSQLLIFLGSFSALIYFYFSKAHKGVIGGIAKFGIWILMIGFGASFGFTVMARISLFINRMQFIDQNWIANAMNSENLLNGSHWPFTLVFWSMIAAFLTYISREIYLHLTSKNETPAEQ